MSYLRRTWAQIDLDNVKHNYLQVRHLLKQDCKMMAVVKANAYGHGDGYVARELQHLGADWFAVSNINEALSLRKQGIDRPILILGATPPERVGELFQNHITQSIFSVEYGHSLSKAAFAKGVSLNCHIIVDTGMSRLGFFAQQCQEENAAREIEEVTSLKALCCTGIFTHFSSADDFSADSVAYTNAQYASFEKVLILLKNKNMTFQLKHCCNSAATLAYPQWHMDMVRPGVVLYGLAPSSQLKEFIDLRPVMSLYSTVAMVKTVGKCVAISYGRRYYTCAPSQQITTIEAGYDDGFRRNFTNKGRVIINGHIAPVVGAVCMDQIMVDSSNCEGVVQQNLVTMVGKEGNCEITLDDYANINGTINYEEACLIGMRVPRVFIKNAKEVGVIDYVLAALPVSRDCDCF